uniref:HEAT repeat containing 9 n=1 Tax=Rhinolophus ferrumequinum TaxID=59479 RepID=A0A671G2L9_RHIFE
MDYKPSVDISDISRSMLKYPWLEYPGRNKELRKASAPVYLSLSCHQIPKEEFPPSPECWRQHPSKPNAIPYCYFKKPELYTHRHTLYDQRQEWEAQKMLQRMRDHPRHLKEDTPIQKVHLPKIKLTIKSQATSKPLHPIGDPPKWLRLKELTNSLNSPREDEQFYAAQILKALTFHHLMAYFTTCLLNQAQTGPEKVKSEACRTLAILGCLNKHVIQSVIKQLTGQNEKQRMDTLMGLRVALNSWAAVPKDKRTPVGDEEKLVPVLQLLIQKSLRATAMEAALCLGFLRPCSNTARQFLLQGLCQGPMTQRMKALRMLVTVMRVHSAAVIKATLDQLCRSSVMEHRFEATQMLKSIGLEQIQAHGLEGLLFDLLREKIYNEPFPAVRHAVAETVEEFKMKPTMMNLPILAFSCLCQGALGIRSPQVFHLLLDMLDEEKNQSVKKTLQETLLLLASIDPWIQKKLKNKALLVYEAPKTKKAEPTRFQNKPENSEELNIQDFRLAQLNPFLIAKASASLDQQKMLNAFPSCFSKPLGHNSPATGSWAPGIRKPFQILAQTPK